MTRDTARFFRLMNEANNAIAARKAEEEEEKQIETDQVRLQRDAERRERLGTLRAREHPGSRPKDTHPVFGHINLGE